ncbi:hypothetical protein Lrub_1090 [Legionella rubrilucens]|uniref:Lytic transglycosylase MltA domain-containing protein n=1 Tax=Legionella rubrilucens TaxID=458 RepID=A0A0W0XWY5_9GAMM|nr:hypothetical protein [Legionella rubrilucens]KTD48739.1 hypothetical protein Lrub_1090 [Legionella rubrilucens]
MNLRTLACSCLFVSPLFAAPHFVEEAPSTQSHYQIDGKALCETAKQTLAYLNHDPSYDPQVLHEGQVLPIPMWRIKATLVFICKHQAELSDPEFVKKQFEFVRWLPDVKHARRYRSKAKLRGIPDNQIVMTEYYVHLAKASAKPTPLTPYAIHGLPADEQYLTLEEANAKPKLTRFQYGKQAILAGALKGKKVPVLAYVSRADLEAALLQGTLVADFGNGKPRYFNVHRNNNIPYDTVKKPEDQERYWYFKEVDGVKGYGKDADHKITVNYEVTFAADLAQFGLGKLLLIQYHDKRGNDITRMGIMADTGGAFADNLYQIDFLTGAYTGKDTFYQANHNLPDYVNAYFMVLKSKEKTEKKTLAGLFKRDSDHHFNNDTMFE